MQRCKGMNPMRALPEPLSVLWQRTKHLSVKSGLHPRRWA
jgi:hypothetical protein